MFVAEYSVKICSMKKSLLNTLLAITLTLSCVAITGCDKSGKDTKNANSSSFLKSSSNDSDAQKAIKKINAYTDSYNKLIGSFGLIQTQNSYIAKDYTNKKSSQELNFSTGWITQGIDILKSGRAISSDEYAGLDKAVDELLPILITLEKQLKSLQIYYQSRAYREDNLARGKAEDESVRANFTASLLALEKFHMVLQVQQKKRFASDLASIKDSGNLLAYDSKLAMHQGEAIAEIFKNTNDISNPEKYKEADIFVADLEKTLISQLQHYREAKEKTNKPDSRYTSVHSDLTQLIGAYRDMKQSKKISDYNKMIVQYNSALNSVNNILR
jgi:Protein of unknown function (DUF3829)